MPQLIPVRFSQKGQYGDFDWMSRQCRYKKSLFIFNDNEEQFLAFQSGRWKRGCIKGGGNAVVRPCQCIPVPRSAGVPTGKCRVGYNDLAEDRHQINRALFHIRSLIEKHNYDAVFYSAAEDGRTLGNSIFNVSPDIKEYIVQGLENAVK